MKELFEKFEQQSTKAQVLLERGIIQMREGLAPDPTLCQDITAALSSLRTAYDDIRRELPEHILEEELLKGDLPIHAYEEAWKNSVIGQKKAVRDVLEEFIRVYSDEKKYMDAIETYVCDAKDLLAIMDSSESQAQFPDVSTFQLFLDGMKADLVSDEELYERLLDSPVFGARIVKGLHDNRYYIRETEAVHEAAIVSMNEDLTTKTESIDDYGDVDPLVSEPVTANTEDTDNESDASDEDKIESLTPDELERECASCAKTCPEEVNVESNTVTEDIEEAVEYIHPIHPIMPAKLPSEQKLKDLINRTGDVFRFLIDKLVFTGLMDENHVFMALAQIKKPLTKEQCIESFAVLERKGLLCTYEFEGRNILCFTELMESGLQKSWMVSTLRRVFNLKKIGKVFLTGKQDMPLDQFCRHMANVDLFMHAIGMLDDDEETAQKLKSSTRNNEKRYFLMNLSLDDSSLLPLHIVDVDSFVSFMPDKDEGVICCMDELPDMGKVDDCLHYCLTTVGLFRWSEGQWIAITHCEAADIEQHSSAKKDTNTTAETVSGALPEDSAEVTAESPKIALSSEPTASIKQTIPVAEPVEGLWLDDLSEETDIEPETPIDEFASLSSAEIAGRLLSIAANGSVPSDESMATLIHQLLEEGVRSNDVHNCHDQLIEAIVLAKLLSSNDVFPMCRIIYYQLHAAIPFFREAGVNTGVALSGVFANETEYTPVTKLCSYIYY